MKTLSTLFLVVSFLACGLAVSGQSPQATEELHEKAKKSGQDNDLRALIDSSVFFAETVGAEPAVKNHITETILILQHQYERGTLSPITEEKLVQVFNSAMAQAGAPSWAQTSAFQLRQLRMGLMLIEPKFMSEGVPKNRANPKEVSHEMNPIQAAHLISQMLIMKLTNKDYQSNDKNWVLPRHPESETDLDVKAETKQIDGAFYKGLTKHSSDTAAAIKFINSVSDSLQK